MSYGWDDDTGSRGSTFDSAKGADYTSARKAYARSSEPLRSSRESTTSTRDYKSRAGKTPAPIGKDIVTDSTHPFVVITDVTGSMSSWPAIIFEKLPLLGKEVERYAPRYAISFAAIGDGRCDDYPLQVRDFDSGKPLDEHISALYPEGGGGDNPESYGLAAYYYLNHCKIEKAVKPILVMILDAPYHDKVLVREIKDWTGDVVQSDLDTVKLFKELQKKFTVYIVLKGSKGDSEYNLWSEIVGSQQVVPMSEPRDVVEILIGIYAGEMGEFKDFEMRSSKRHSDKADRVSRVGKSLKSVAEKSAKISEIEGGAESGKSKLAGKAAGGKSLKSKKLV